MMTNEPTHIYDYLHKQALDRPDKPALICDDRTLTFKELSDEVNQMAAYMANQIGEQTGQQVVALLLSNSWQFVVAHLGTLQAGHIVMPIDPTYKKLEVSGITDQQKPVHVITTKALASEFDPSLPITTIDDLPWRGAKTDLAFLRLPADKQAATLLFTSGTTGKPKITAYSHSNHMWNSSVVAPLWKWNDADTILLSTPLSHWHGLAVILNGALLIGNTVYIQERFDPEKTLTKLASGDITLYMHVPIAYYKMVEHAPEKTYDLSKVRLFVSGSSYLPPDIWQQFKDRFGHEILERYGSSETGLIASNPLDERLPGSVGYVLPGVELRIQEDGEIAMKSPGLFMGYYGNPEATAAKTIEDGFWLTGDIGDFENGDKTARFKLRGRVQEKMKKNGYTLFPRDLEWAIMHNEHVADAFVLGLTGENALSDTLVYFLVTDLSEAEIQAYCKENLPAAWRPDRIVFLPEIPKSPAGKPKLAKLKESLKETD
ncbi:MAG: class I adenylate-forming enzyme family protein [Candidatus Saccharimonadales bacterium]